MTAATMSAGFDRQRWAKVADWLAVAVAVTLPWSTTATAIFITGWLIVVLATLNIGSAPKGINDRRRPATCFALGAGSHRHVMG